MKKNLLITGFILLAITLSGCFNPIFYEINNDVAPEESTVSGTVRNIARYTVSGKEYLVTVADSGIKYKPVDTTSNTYSKHGCWKNYNIKPEGYVAHYYDYYNEEHIGEQMIKIVTDAENIYLITTTYRKDIDEGSAVPDKVNLYTTKITSLAEDNVTWTDSKWEKIDTASDLFPVFKPSKSDYFYSAFNMFSTNSVQTGHRKAYIRSGGFLNYLGVTLSDTEKETYGNPVYYELNGTELKPVTVTAFDEADYSDDTKATKEMFGCNSAVWINDGVQFFYSDAAETNENYNDNATVVYYGIEKTLFYALASDLSTHVSTFVAGSVPITCLGVCADSLLIGLGNIHGTSSSASGGIKKTVLVNGLPKKTDDKYDGIVSFSTNAEIKFKSSYLILALLNEDPSKNELDSNLFCSISFIGTGTSNSTSYNNIGLWSYYPTRGNWNCE